MEEDVGVKVTVTRLRRRLSVEQSEDGSSPAPSTPTKKRGGRLATKPQLELIDENTPVSSPRKTRRKSLATEAEEKPITPSRRSARIKSNSSIVSDTQLVQVTNSPRAKRAARRNSQAGSDNEGPATPARQTRRTRKDSASSVENQDTGTLSKTLPVVEMVIEEEPENEVQKADNKSQSSLTAASEEISPNSPRKSKRLLEKRNRRSGSLKTDQDCSTCTVENKSLNISTTNEKASSESITRSPLNKSVKSKEFNDELSESNMSLLKKLDTEIKMNKSSHNKSASALNTEPNDKGKRNRTESWPTITASAENESINFSDNELSKKRKDKSNKMSANNDSPKIDKANTSMNDKTTSESFLDTSSKRKKRQSETSLTKDTTSKDDSLETKEALVTKENIISRNETPTVKSDNTNVTNDLTILFGNAPGNVQAIVCFEDSDSNGAGTVAADKIGHLDIEDQCVPVVKHNFKESLSPKEPTIVSNDGELNFSNQVINDNNSHILINLSKGVKNDVDNSCEPMDIDETIHEDILQKSRETLDKSITEHKSSQDTTTLEETVKSKRKSSIINFAADTSDRSKEENKSTLILSQIKDVSSTSDNLNSPNPTQTNEVLSKSDINVHSNINKKMPKGNISLNDIEGTPKQKTIQKLTMQTSTPITTQQLDKKTKVDEENEGTKNNIASFSKPINNSDYSEDDSDDEPSVEKSRLLDDEAEEASDDYESGDSQDEEERKYEAENEILERGETITSDDDISNDTDYEKDSFVVSSDAEDNELLSGSGDDLAMSDNELTMSKKSKKKFNERKLKEQKNASREMFESRHKLNTLDQKSPNPKTKKNKMRLDSSLLASDEEVVTKPKKSNRMRLDSTLETSAKQEDNNVSLNKSKKKDKSLPDTTLNISDKQEDTNVSLKIRNKNNKSMQDSICSKSTVDEKEVTIINESAIDNTDPLRVNLKQEPQTPQKDLNISVVQFTDRQEIEKVQITESNYILNQTGTDPLQVTMACDETSDSSECEEIMQNYDYVLNELNKDKKSKLNNNNVSLDMESKNKKNRVEPIIDQLNLTHTKKTRKNKNHSEDVLDSKPIESLETKPDSDSEDSSNSIDLQLLFSEDKCGSEEESQRNKADNDSLFIPLGKSPGKINLRESIDSSQADNETSINKSTAKKNKEGTSLALESAEEPEELVGNESFLNKSNSKKNKQRTSLTAAESQDLQAIHVEDTKELNKSNSKKKKQRTFSAAETTAENIDIRNSSSSNESGLKQKKKRSISEPTVEESQDIWNKSKDNNASLNESGLKKKKKHSILETPVAELQDILNKSKDASLNQSGLKKKKKHSITEPVTEETHDILNKSKNTNVSLNESGIKKKKKHSISDPAAEESHDINNLVEPVLNESVKKKKKRKSSLNVQDTEQVEGDLFFIDTKGTLEDAKDFYDELDEPSLNVLFESKKKKIKNKLNLSRSEIEEKNYSKTTEESNAVKTPKSEKKKEKKTSQKVESLETTEESNAVKTPKSEKKKEKKISQKVESLETTEESNAVKTPKSEKKKEKKISQKVESLVCDEDSDSAPDEAPYLSVKATEADLQNTETVSESAATGSEKKKKKKKKKSSAASQSDQNLDTEDNIAANSKKRKRKSSNSENSQYLEDAQESVETEMLNELTGSHKKKRKISHIEDNSAVESKHPKKKNKKIRDIVFQETAFELETANTQIKKNKKRKNREEDGDNKQTKVSKDSSFQEVHVPRIPDSILTQLDDKPRKLDTPKVIATSNFIVENARQKRAKPSNYLEESIYLDANSPIAKKEKPRIKKPKVLPFIPTASISDSGFTTNFKINKLSQTTKFEAEPFGFSKESYLQKKSIKRLGTYDRYKKQIHHKMSKF